MQVNFNSLKKIAILENLDQMQLIIVLFFMIQEQNKVKNQANN